MEGALMAESRERFETYPYEPGAPAESRLQDPKPAAMQPRQIVPPPPPPKPPGIGRRVVLFGAAGVVAVGLAGAVALGPLAHYSDPVPIATASPEIPDDEDGLEVSYAMLDTSYGSMDIEVPADWTVDSEGSFLQLSHEQGMLSARGPERVTATAEGLAREADYLRDGFDPGDGEALVVDESDNRLTVLVQTRAGHFGGEPATEHVTLLADPDPDTERSLVISWVTVDAAKDPTGQARGMDRQLQRQFENY